MRLSPLPAAEIGTLGTVAGRGGGETNRRGFLLAAV